MSTNDDIQMLCNNVNLIRRTHNLSREDFASRLNVSTDFIVQLENGILPPETDLEFLYNLCDQFHISIVKIFKPMKEL